MVKIFLFDPKVDLIFILRGAQNGHDSLFKIFIRFFLTM